MYFHRDRSEELCPLLTILKYLATGRLVSCNGIQSHSDNYDPFLYLDKGLLQIKQNYDVYL